MHDPLVAKQKRRTVRDPPGGSSHIIFADEFTNEQEFAKQEPLAKSPVPKEHYLPPDAKPSPPKFKYNRRRPSTTPDKQKPPAVTILLNHNSPDNRIEIKKRGSVGGADNLGPQCMARSTDVKALRFSKARVKNAVGSLDNIGPQCLERTSGPITPKSGRKPVAAVGGKDSIGPQCLNRTDVAPPLKLRENKKNQQYQDSIEFCLNRADQPVMRKGRVGGPIGGKSSITECFNYEG